MCGVTGLWNLNEEPIDDKLLARFTDSLSHRGPDGNGFFIDAEANLGLGHRRLAIIDVTDGGRQPMSFYGGRYWITFNGEIYNFLELKSELASFGCQFKTDSDTEVILAAYEVWGEACQLKFNGMWAFAIWDRQERKLFVSRDRFGVKPLIYYFDEKHFAFASETKAFLALDWFNLEYDPKMVSLALTNERLIEGHENGLLRGLHHLLGGHSLTLKKGEAVKIRRWWTTLDHLETPPQRYEDQAERFRELFLDACRIRMRSDVPIGTALSGGLDSSSILCGMSHIRKTTGDSTRLAPEWQKAFVMTYPGSVIDERKYADEAIRLAGAIPIYCTGAADMYLEHYDSILFHMEEISDIHLGPWLVHKTQRENGVVVTIDGHGGDEALGGYPWHVTAALKDSIRNFSPPRIRKFVSTMRSLELFPGERFLIKSVASLIGKLKAGRPNPWLFHSAAGFVNSAYSEDISRLKGKDFLFNSLYIDFHFTHLPTVLRNFDRLSMAHGVEVRSPFMDWRLISYLFSLPATTKIGSGFTKRILRDALQGILPEAVRLRTQKLGFPNLPEAWSQPRAMEFMRDTINSAQFQRSPIWNGRRIADDFSKATREKNDRQLHRIGIFVQAMSLINLFDEKRKSRPRPQI